ncbi:AAEL001021-PA [Aedes aegypti]|uniref:AAEL001021-PA n=1 Tax=Aedes aegypti TaxID=7159 RepID=Q17MH6_AEDAE|nr:AAEL001021-PA [Aedes aegypti]
MQRVLLLFLLRFIITIISIPHADLQTIGTDCNGKSFICIDSNQYQICIDQPGGRSETVDDVGHLCPPDTYCNNDEVVECGSTKPSGADGSPVSISGMDSFSVSSSTTMEILTAVMDSEIANFGTLDTIPAIPSETPEAISVVGDTAVLTPNTLTIPPISSTVETEEDMEENTTIDLGSTETDATTDGSSTDSTESLSSSTEPATSTFATISIESQPEDTAPETSMSIPLSTPPESPATTSTEGKSFVCKSPGRYPHESDCRKYYVCVPLQNGLSKLEVSCSFNMAYDPILQRCVANRQNLCQPLKDTFACISVGRFPDSSNPAHYVLCSKNGDAFQMYQLACPLGQRFNAVLGQCQNWFGPAVVITSDGMQTVAVDESEESDSQESDSESEESDDSSE